MNIFVLDEDPQKAAAYHCDKHVIKMLTETTQILSTVQRIHGNDIGYKATHQNHPCVKWVSESRSNYCWLLALGLFLYVEYLKRYGMSKTHRAGEIMVKHLLNPPEQLSLYGSTPFPLVMPQQYQTDDVVESYREYYRKEKRSFATWKTRVPDWF